MNDVDDMPSKCHDCPYWMQCEEPYVCPDNNTFLDMFDMPDASMLESLLSTK